MTDQEKTHIESLRSSISKSTLRYIYSVYDAHNGTNNDNCWCSIPTRKTYAAKFFTWFDEQIEIENNKSDDE